MTKSRVSHTDPHENTFKVLTEETKKRGEVNYTQFIRRSPSMNTWIQSAKVYGHGDAAELFVNFKSLSEEHEYALRYALCRSIIFIRNRHLLDPKDKFEIITILIKDWKYGCKMRQEKRELLEFRKNTMKKIKKKQTFRYPGAGI